MHVWVVEGSAMPINARDLLSAHIKHVIPYGEEDLHTVSQPCPCKPMVLGDFTMHLSWEEWPCL